MALRFSLPIGLAFALLVTTSVTSRADTWLSKAGLDHPLVGRIFDVSTGSEIDETALFSRAAAAEFLLLGEKHDNADHHRLQARVLDRTATARQPAVVMEMLNPDQLPALRAHRQRLPADIDGLRAILDWDRTGWPAWSIYRPIFAAAATHDLPIRAGNLPRKEIRQISRGGYDAVKNAAVRQHLMDNPPADATRAAMRTSIIASHCGHASEAIVPGMIAIQRARDATMAQAMIEAAQDAARATLIAGTGHTRNDRGVPRFIRSLGGNETLVSIALMEIRPGLIELASYAAIYGADSMPFDFVWFTPAVEFTDPCEKFRYALERMKKKPPPGSSKPEGK